MKKFDLYLLAAGGVFILALLYMKSKEPLAVANTVDTSYTPQSYSISSAVSDAGTVTENLDTEPDEPFSIFRDPFNRREKTVDPIDEYDDNEPSAFDTALDLEKSYRYKPSKLWSFERWF